MIAGLCGTLVLREPDRVVVDVGGVRYECFVSLTTLGDLGDEGARVDLLTYLHVREDAMLLYGFSSQREKRLFRALIGVTGIGPKLAMTVLSGLAVADLARAVVGGDLARLTAIPGVGRKMAERIVLELGETLKKDLSIEPAEAAKPSGLLVEDQLLSALMNLGYRDKQVRKVVERLAASHAPDTGLEELIRAALREMQ